MACVRKNARSRDGPSCSWNSPETNVTEENICWKVKGKKDWTGRGQLDYKGL